VKFWLTILLAATAFITSVRAADSDTSAREVRQQNLAHTFATYSAPPRTPDGRVDVKLLAEQLTDLHANTYSFCIWANTNDWDDLKLFLPIAREHHLRVWAGIVPPSESPPHGKRYSEPFKVNYDEWATEIAKLSVSETNLVAWSIDDFTYNTKLFTPERLAKMLAAARAINPKLAFVPCCYFKSFTPEFATNYTPIVDGILFPYRHESAIANLKDPTLTVPEIKRLKELTGTNLPIILDVYATAHSRLGKTTPEYVEQVMTAAHGVADGVMVYCHQDPKTNAEKYQIVKRLFTKWSE
jgi:hypothetical protein